MAWALVAFAESGEEGLGANEMFRSDFWVMVREEMKAWAPDETVTTRTEELGRSDVEVRRGRRARTRVKCPMWLGCYLGYVALYGGEGWTYLMATEVSSPSLVRIYGDQARHALFTGKLLVLRTDHRQQATPVVCRTEDI